MNSRSQQGRSPMGSHQVSQDKTFSPLEKQEIERRNEMLLMRMMQIHGDSSNRKGGGFSRNQGYCPKHPSSSAINRSRQQSKIAEENLKIAARLGNVRTATSCGRSGKSIVGNSNRCNSA